MSLFGGVWYGYSMGSSTDKRQSPGLLRPRHKRGDPWGPCMGVGCDQEAALTKQGSNGRYYEVCRNCSARIDRNGAPIVTRQPWLSEAKYDLAIEYRLDGMGWRQIAKIFRKEPGNMRRLVLKEAERRGERGL